MPLILSLLGLILIVVLIIVVFCDFKKKEKEILNKTESCEGQVNDLGDMIGSARNWFFKVWIVHPQHLEIIKG